MDAINNRNYVQLNYVDKDGSAVGNRLVQPYAYGRSRAGNPVVRVFQVSGDSLRKKEWKTLRLDRIITWKPRKQTFSVPPNMAGYNNAPAYNENGDDGMSVVFAQVRFDLDKATPLERERMKMAGLSNAPKVPNAQKMGPIPYASQQWKKNVYTSQPNSKKYDMYRKNIEDTENEFNRFDDDVWAKAEAEAEQNRRESEDKLKTVNNMTNLRQGPLPDNDYYDDEEFN